MSTDSRSETIRQALTGVEAAGDAELPVSFFGAVSQVNIICHATININSLQIIANGELRPLELYLRPKGRKRKKRKGKVTR